MPRPARANLRHRRRSDLLGRTRLKASSSCSTPLPVTHLQRRGDPQRLRPDARWPALKSTPRPTLPDKDKPAAADAIHATALKHAPKMAIHKAHQDVLPSDVRPSRNVIVRGKGGVANLVHSNDSPAIGAYNPTQVRTAYGINLLPTSNEGQGVTVAIVDVFVDPNIRSDVSTFSTQYGLPQMDGVGGDPSFTIVTQPGTPNSPQDGSDQVIRAARPPSTWNGSTRSPRWPTS